MNFRKNTFIYSCVLFVTCFFCGCDSNFSSGMQSEQYTVLLMEFRGSKSRDLAEWYRANSIKHTGWSEIDLVFIDNKYQLIRGTFPTRNSAESVCARSRSWKSSDGTQVFKAAKVIPVPGQEIGPREYNLKHCKKGYYTFQIAAFFDMYKKDYPHVTALKKDYVGRKNFAITYCKRLRDSGYEAYFYHGPHTSIVTIGTFGWKAIQTKTVAVYHPESRKKSTREKHLMIDEGMKKLEKKFPYMQVNGSGEISYSMNPTTMKLEPHKQRTYPIIIPGREKLPPNRGSESNKGPTPGAAGNPSINR